MIFYGTRVLFTICYVDGGIGSRERKGGEKRIVYDIMEGPTTLNMCFSKTNDNDSYCRGIDNHQRMVSDNTIHLGHICS